MKDLPQKLREARSKLGMSQTQFAEAIGASQGSVSKWEAGRERPSAFMMSKISNLTGQPTDYFFENSEYYNERSIGWPNFPKIVAAIEARFVENAFWKSSIAKVLIVPVPEQLFSVSLEGYVVLGDRANNLYQNGDFVLVARESDYKFKLLDDDIVLVRRYDEAGRMELSLRRYLSGTPAWLWPITDDPEYQLPLKEHQGSSNAEDPQIIGIVVASYRVHDAAHRPIMPRGQEF